MSSRVVEFGFENSTVVPKNNIDTFEQSKTGQKNRISVVAFQPRIRGLIAKKTQEKGAPLTDEEKTALVVKLDAKLSEVLNKKVEELTEADRVDPAAPRWIASWTHFHADVGTIRCYSDYDHEGNVVDPKVCCRKYGDAKQVIASIVMIYPMTDDGQTDFDLLNQKKSTYFQLLKLNGKKYKTIESVYKDMKNEDPPRFTIDLKVTLDGDPKFKNQKFEGSSASFLNKNVSDETRSWIYDRGIRLWKHVDSILGYDMPMEKFLEKTGGGGSAAGDSKALAADEAPKVDYAKLTSLVD